MMSEQTANLCTTDACESLRALLAKYEDAEGRPAVDESWRLIKNKELRNVERLRSLSNHLLQCAHCAVKPDISIDGSGKILMFHDCLAFENRRIVKVSGDDKHIINTWENLTFPPEEEKTYNIAALKAQPSGVVLPVRADSVAAASGYHKGWNACLDEVARLNSSPVSSAPSHGEQVREGWKLVPVEPTEAMLREALSYDSIQDPNNPDSRVEELLIDWSLMLSAAPSAVSQEQGE
jgi:hypothetical protein